MGVCRRAVVRCDGTRNDGAHIRTPRATAVVAAATLAVAACNGDDDPGPDPDPVPAPEAPEDDEPDDDLPGDADDQDDLEDPPADPDAGGDDDADGTDEQVAPLEEVATTDDREQANDGSGLTVTDVRVGTHDGFDRVTVEIAGDAEVGWFASWTDEPIEDGSGQVAEVEGDAYLTVAARGMALPADRPDDVTAWDGQTVTAPDGAPVLVEVVEGVLFEGQQQLFVGATEEVPFRLERLEDPQRIVIDLVR